MKGIEISTIREGDNVETVNWFLETLMTEKLNKFTYLADISFEEGIV